MNIKLHIGEVVPLLDKRISMAKVAHLLIPLARQSGLCLPELQVGAGYLQWTLPGTGWIPFTEVDDACKSAVARIYNMRKSAVLSALEGSSIKEMVLVVPSDEFIYCRVSGEEWEIALVAWAYRYPDRLACGELDGWIQKTVLQEVNIGFVWRGDMLLHLPFRLMGYSRATSEDGWFHVDQKVEVGRSLQIDTLAGKQFTLKVEKGKSDYSFDLTQFFSVGIEVRQEGIPVSGKVCKIDFAGELYELQTDDSGRCEQVLPLQGNGQGLPEQPQPDCHVVCEEDIQCQVPVIEGEKLHFIFEKKVLPTEPIEKPVEDSVSHTIHPPVSDSDVIPIQKSEFVEEKIQESEYVFIRLLDYGKFPLPDLDFVLITKKKGEVSLKTDKEGYCKVPKEWFTHKEKIQVKFSIHEDYMALHDLHDQKKKRKIRRLWL